MEQKINEVFESLVNILRPPVVKDGEDLIKCPHCKNTDFIIQRDMPVFIGKYKWEDNMRTLYKEEEVNYFCTYCKKDF